MKVKSSARLRVLSAFKTIVWIVLLGYCSSAWAQGITTAGLTGAVTDSGGRAVAGAAVVAIHTPTGTSFSAVTLDSGRFFFRGLIAGGPYSVTVSAPGFKAAERMDLIARLGQDNTSNFVLETSNVVVMDAFKVAGRSGDLDAGATGASQVLEGVRLSNKPTTQRSLADLVSASSFVTLASLSSANDREEAHIVAVGQNNRYNSVLIDGSPINDQFGLNGTGLASFFNPLSIDVIDQLAIDVSPYDTRQSGFTGAAVNAVTKSGTNSYRGSLYYTLSKDRLFGMRGQGPDVAVGPTAGKVPLLKRETRGLTFGGPIIKNRLFFFINYEKFVRVAPALTAGLNPDSADVTAITSRIADITAAVGKGDNFGTYSQNISNQAQEEKKLAKVDWNIVKGQRLSLRYSQTPGEVPQFGDYGTASFGSGILTNSGGGTSVFGSAFYSQIRKERNLTGSLASQWTQNFKTEIRYGDVKQDQYTPIVATLPQVRIFGINGTNNAGVRISNGVLEMGTDQFRMGNQINVHTRTYSVSADYFLGNVALSGGIQHEKNDDYNLFRAGSFGIFDFANIAAFQADTPNGFSRAYYVQGTPQADVSDSSLLGFFAQAKWDALPRLSLSLGVRQDAVASSTRPPFNQLFKDRFGFANNGTIDGVNEFSPRFGFNWAVDEVRTTQVRGGVGRFLGRAPWVFFSNSYSAPGVGRFTDIPSAGNIPTLVNYLKNTFDPAKPIGVANSVISGGRFEVDLTDDKIHLPSVWRGNLAVDRKLPFWNSTLTLEAVQTYNDQALFITNDNLLPTTKGADGRQRFAGNVNTAANARFAEFLNVYHTRNVRTGESRYLSLSWDRAMKDHWAANFAYTRGRSTEASSMGQTTASGMWQRNSVFNQNAVEEAHSDYEVRDRVQASYTREFAFSKGWKTSVSLYYEGRTGNPFSYVYSTDLNGDSQSNNDLVAVPSGASDARFDFSLMNAADQAAYFNFLQSSGLNKFAGGIAPKNAFYQPWVNRLDLHLSQVIPLYRPAELEVFFDFINFGTFLSRDLFNYFEKAPLSSNDVFWRMAAGGATYGPDGRIRPTYSATSVNANNALIYDNVQSRWRIQVGARLKF